MSIRYYKCKTVSRKLGSETIERTHHSVNQTLSRSDDPGADYNVHYFASASSSKS